MTKARRNRSRSHGALSRESGLRSNAGQRATVFWKCASTSGRNDVFTGVFATGVFATGVFAGVFGRPLALGGLTVAIVPGLAHATLAKTVGKIPLARLAQRRPRGELVLECSEIFTRKERSLAAHDRSRAHANAVDGQHETMSGTKGKSIRSSVYNTN